MCMNNAKTMTYEEIRDLCEQKRTTVTSVSEEMGITLLGLKKGLQNESLGIKNVMELCRVLDIDPNTFCGWNRESGDVNYGNMQKGAKKQVMTVGSSEELKRTIDMLEQELKTKNEQIAKLIEKL